jgi:hypothetical protein
VIIVLVQEILGDVFHEWLVFVGITYVILIVFLPKGLFPLFAKTSPQTGSTYEIRGNSKKQDKGLRLREKGPVLIPVSC